MAQINRFYWFEQIFQRATYPRDSRVRFLSPHDHTSVQFSPISQTYKTFHIVLCKFYHWYPHEKSTQYIKSVQRQHQTHATTMFNYISLNITIENDNRFHIFPQFKWTISRLHRSWWQSLNFIDKAAAIVFIIISSFCL